MQPLLMLLALLGPPLVPLFGPLPSLALRRWGQRLRQLQPLSAGCAFAAPPWMFSARPLQELRGVTRRAETAPSPAPGGATVAPQPETRLPARGASPAKPLAPPALGQRRCAATATLAAGTGKAAAFPTAA